VLGVGAAQPLPAVMRESLVMAHMDVIQHPPVRHDPIAGRYLRVSSNVNEHPKSHLGRILVAEHATQDARMPGSRRLGLDLDRDRTRLVDIAAEARC
jgi:hypothetical protein